MDTIDLSPTKVCVLFELGSPIWNGGKKMAGLATYRIGKDNEIHFTYRRKSDGKLSIPDAYYFDGDLLKTNKYQTQQRGSVELVLIPFDDLKIIRRTTEQAVPKLIHEIFFEQREPEPQPEVEISDKQLGLL